MRCLQIVIILLTFQVYQKYLIEAIVVSMTSVECRSFNESFCVFKQCQLKPISRGVKELSVYVKLLDVPVNNASLRLELKRRGYFTQAIYAYEIDSCAFFRNKKRNPLANAFYTFLKFGTNSNMNHTCPYNHDLIMDRYRIDQNLKFSLPIEKGDYTIISYWYFYNGLRATIRTNLQFHD